MAEAKKTATKTTEETPKSTETKTKKYEVIRAFTDAQDNYKEYEINNIYPNPANKKVSEERIQELLSHPNGKSYIKELEEN
ncbi:hypothetical protein ERX35_007840 [Macrococcus equipercicus]|uniref:Uncharacterized protein n=1 Tax=Macrococcus equipercicus TaxID=69967 RepID=A0ABQ6R7Q1_9STAP|nr:hypothetical protein [Macrococcus equipercicus]KAA1039118.1 hypothetical protein ERX35_007840 [Macrococcus equipercicus]